MADSNKRGFVCDDDCGGEGGEGGERGKRGKRGHRGHDGRDGRDGEMGAMGPTGPAAADGLVLDPSPPTFTGNGTAESPLQVINVAPQPFVSPPEIITIYVRATGDDANDGMTIATALRTVQAATLLIPMFIPAGVYYTIDATDLIDGGAELLPPNYALPAWKAPVTVTGLLPLAPSSSARCAVTLNAELRDVPDLGSDAVIVEGDLETTDVGGPILSASNTTPIVITTTTQHGLVQSPFGIFGVFAGLVQVVEISGVVGNAAANDFFLALVTGPDTFELYDFDLNPVVGSGAGAGGTVTVLFVKDQFSGQVQVKISDARASWLPNDSLKGNIVTDAFGNTAVIYANTDDTLSLATNGGFDLTSLRITEPSCVLQCSPSEMFETEGALLIGGFNVVNVDSMCLSGIEVRAASDGSGFFHSGGVCRPTKCVLEAPNFALQGVAFTESSHLIFPSYNGVIIDQNRCLVENMSGTIDVYWSAYHGTVIIQEEAPIPNDSGAGIAGTVDIFVGLKVISAANPVFLINSGSGVRLWGVSIEGGGSDDAIHIGVQGFNQLFSVGGSGWSRFALVVDNGAQVEVDRFTFAASGDEMQVGVSPFSLGSRTFDEFRTGLDGCPVRQQGDITSVDSCGYLGTASRVFQRDP